MQTDLTKYTAFYKNKHQGHKLDWDHALGTATLRARFARGEKELSVSLYQALVLLLFNEDSEIGFADIKERTRIGESSCVSETSSCCVFRYFETEWFSSARCDTDICAFFVNRRRGTAKNAAEPGVGQETGTEETADGEGRARHGRVRVQPRLQRRSVPGTHQLHPSERDRTSHPSFHPPIHLPIHPTN